jgi:methionyl-tRNA formyltransferase
MPTSPFTISIAGSTSHTVQCAQALLDDGRFKVTWILTPPPKPIGRKQVITKNALHVFAEEHQIPVIFVDKKIDSEVQSAVEDFDQPDFLLVVDFGYLIPDWLLKWPKIAPLNVHPSLLPRWRGSSPGQFVLLYGEKESAVTVIVMNEGLDTGDIVAQEKFDVQSNWTQTEYYQFSFDLIGGVLAEKIVDLGEGRLQPKPQPVDSPTSLARRFTKDDGFVSWSIVEAAMTGVEIGDGDASALLKEASALLCSWPAVIANATRGLAPWPGVWTIIETDKGQKRMKILSAKVVENKLVLGNVQIEGQIPEKFSENLISD